MKHSILLISLLGMSALSTAQIPFVKGKAIDAKLQEITLDADQVNLNFGGSPATVSAKKSDVSVSFGQVVVNEAAGWNESAYVEFAKYPGASSYNVYVKSTSDADFTKIDAELVRDYAAYMRADVVGLKAGSCQLRVVPVDADGKEVTSAATTTDELTVAAYDRAGFAHLNVTDGVGAYKNDGTLKADVRVIYVTAKTAKTVSLPVVTDSKGKETTFTGIQAIVNGYQKGYEKRPLCVRFIGLIEKDDCDALGSKEEGLQVKGKSAYSPMNMTFEGIGYDATIRGFGFLIRNCASVELRNFANMLCLDDAISIDTDNKNIWVHNLDLFYGKPGSASDQVKGDGTVDMKGDSQYITVSYNHFWDNGKSSLCGMKSETGPNWITYHHNWFDHSDSRHPRIRTMSVHVWNNYYDGNSKYGVGAAYQSNAFVEANYFRACKYPMLISMQGSDVATDPKGTFSGEDGGMIKSFANYMTGQKRYVTYQQNATEFDAYEVQDRNETVPANVVAKQGGRKYDNWDVDASLMYTYTPDAAADVPAKVTGPLGAGRMGHGDFRFTFTTADDSADAVNAKLKQAITDYTPSVVL